MPAVVSRASVLEKWDKIQKTSPKQILVWFLKGNIYIVLNPCPALIFEIVTTLTVVVLFSNFKLPATYHLKKMITKVWSFLFRQGFIKTISVLKCFLLWPSSSHESYLTIYKCCFWKPSQCACGCVRAHTHDIRWHSSIIIIFRAVKRSENPRVEW